MKRFSIVLFRRKIGFTLTEILIVVVLIGILASISLPKLVKTIEKAKVGEAISNLNLIRAGEKVYFLEYREFGPSMDYLNVEDPNSASSYFTYTIESADTSDFSAKAERDGGPYDGYSYWINKNGVIWSDDAPF